MYTRCACDLKRLCFAQAKVQKDTQNLQANMREALYKVKKTKQLQDEDASKLEKLQGQQQALREAMQYMEAMQTHEIQA